MTAKLSHPPLTKANLEQLEKLIDPSEGPEESKESKEPPPLTIKQVQEELYAIMRALCNFPPEGHEVLKADELCVGRLYEVRLKKKAHLKPDLGDITYWVAKLEYFRARYIAINQATLEPLPTLISSKSEFDEDRILEDRHEEYTRNWGKMQIKIEEWIRAQQPQNLSQASDLRRESSPAPKLLSSRSRSLPRQNWRSSRPSTILKHTSQSIDSILEEQIGSRSKGTDTDCEMKCGTKRRHDYDDELVEEHKSVKRKTSHPLQTNPPSKRGRRNGTILDTSQKLRRSSRIAAREEASRIATPQRTRRRTT